METDSDNLIPKLEKNYFFNDFRKKKIELCNSPIKVVLPRKKKIFNGSYDVDSFAGDMKALNVHS